METPDFRRPRNLRLNRSNEFIYVRENGKSARGRYLRLSAAQKEQNAATAPESKIGIITSRKAGGAVARVRLRRLFREIHRLHRADLIRGCWIVIIPHREAISASFEELHKEWLHLARKLSILQLS